MEDIDGMEWALTRAGLLRVIAFGKNENTFTILKSIAEGLAQFDAAERVVIIAENARREVCIPSFVVLPSLFYVVLGSHRRKESNEAP